MAVGHNRTGKDMTILGSTIKGMTGLVHSMMAPDMAPVWGIRFEFWRTARQGTVTTRQHGEWHDLGMTGMGYNVDIYLIGMRTTCTYI